MMGFLYKGSLIKWENEIDSHIVKSQNHGVKFSNLLYNTSTFDINIINFPV